MDVDCVITRPVRLPESLQATNIPLSTAPGWMYASSYEDWWGIATAVGTVGAVAVAVSADWRRSRSERAKSVMRAKLLAPRIGIRLVSVRTDLKALLSQWSKLDNPFSDQAEKGKAVDWAEQKRQWFQMEEVEIIAGGSEKCATHLSRGLTYLEIFSDLLLRVAPESGGVETLEKKSINYIRQAQTELDRASKECVKWKGWK